MHSNAGDGSLTSDHTLRLYRQWRMSWKPVDQPCDSVSEVPDRRSSFNDAPHQGLSHSMAKEVVDVQMMAKVYTSLSDSHTAFVLPPFLVVLIIISIASTQA